MADNEPQQNPATPAVQAERKEVPATEQERAKQARNDLEYFAKLIFQAIELKNRIQFTDAVKRICNSELLYAKRIREELPGLSKDEAAKIHQDATKVLSIIIREANKVFGNHEAEKAITQEVLDQIFTLDLDSDMPSPAVADQKAESAGLEVDLTKKLDEFPVVEQRTPQPELTEEEPTPDQIDADFRKHLIEGLDYEPEDIEIVVNTFRNGSEKDKTDVTNRMHKKYKEKRRSMLATAKLSEDEISKDLDEGNEELLDALEDLETETNQQIIERDLFLINDYLSAIELMLERVPKFAPKYIDLLNRVAEIEGRILPKTERPTETKDKESVLRERLMTEMKADVVRIYEAEGHTGAELEELVTIRLPKIVQNTINKIKTRKT